MSRSYTPAIDWLKCLGIAIIIYGHVAAWAPFADLPPIYSKQLGVAFFLFASGYSLTTETRERWHVAFNRLFEIYLFGVPFALLVTALAFAVTGRLQLSNYLPFLTGANVVFNSFPANPTTWYLGTYIHVVMLWALLVSRIRVTATVLLCAVVVEIAVRVLLLESAGRFVAYMLVSNWSAVFLLGCWHGRRRRERADGDAASAGFAVPAGAALLCLLGGWLIVTARMPFERTFPFMDLHWHGPLSSALVVSIMISTLYFCTTELLYQAVATLPAPAAVRFVARNSLFIVLAHMPLYWGMVPILTPWVASRSVRSLIYVIVCLPGLSLVSEGVHRVVRPRELRDRLFARVVRNASSHAEVVAASPHSRS